MDPLGQGVSRKGEVVTFIPKTLPSEQGQAVITRKRKGVQFARLKELTTVSPLRSEPACVYFEACPGCHYLHTDYQSELRFKQQAFARMLKPFNISEAEIEVKASPKRLGYRNRLQLHYREHRFGLIDAVHDAIVEIPKCKILEEPLRQEMRKFYQSRAIPKSEPSSGHCELYLKDDQVQVVWNKAYADGGFTQVNQAMNEILRDSVAALGADEKDSPVLDLFSGSGNLSEAFFKAGRARLMLDASPNVHSLKDYRQLNLFKPAALETFKREFKKINYELMLIDPPRKGFSLFKAWVDAVKPKKIIYVSCKAATMLRDVKEISCEYKIKKVMLLDLFPGSYHFEALLLLEK